MRTLIIPFAILFLFISCKNASNQETEDAVYNLKEGMYRVKFETMDNYSLAFNMKVNSPNDLEIYNAEETIEAEEISYINDSVVIRFPAFEGFLKGKMVDSSLTGFFIKESLNRAVPFIAVLGVDSRFDVKENANSNVGGIWEVDFSANNPDDHYKAKGIFMQNGNNITGTFRTLTGDYRFLDGVLDGDSLKLSAFDASHAFLFVAKVTDSTMEGTFYSGNHFKESFTGKRNSEFELEDASTLTFLKEGYDKIEFEFPDTEGNSVSLSDDQFKDKVIVLQIMGSWCPNCLDESRFLAEYYDSLNNSNFEIIGLAFEYAKTEEKALQALNRLKKDIGINYPLLLAQYGSSNKKLAQEKLPMLNQVLSYPTTIILDKQKNVVSIHTGFNGPATGEKYEEFKEEFSKSISELLEK